MKKILGFILFLSFWSCTDNCKDKIDVSSIRDEAVIVRLDQEIQEVKTPGDMHVFLDQHQRFNAYLMKTTFPSPEVAETELFKMATNKSFDPLTDAIDSTFSDFQETEEELNLLFKRTKHFYPAFDFPEVNTVYTGFGGIDLTQGEDYILIGLDYFLGKNAKYKPVDFPEYILKYYTPENLPYKVALLLSKRFNNADPKDLSLLSYMIYYGKAFYFASQVLPCLEPHQIVEYSEEEYEDALAHANIIWGHMIEKKLFFETKRIVVSKYVDERPNVLEIGEKCPGRIGRWLGYEIVKKYMENNSDVTLQDIMAETDAQLILKGSKYQP